MFLITDVFFFFHGDIELQRVRSDENSSSILQCRRPTPRRNHQQKHHMFVLPELENSVFLDLVLYRTFLLSFFTVQLHSYTVKYTFLIFFYQVEFNRAKKPTLEGSA